MSFVKKCLSGEGVDVQNQRKWYKVPNNKNSLKGSLKGSTSSKKPHLQQTFSPEQFDSFQDNKLSHFYNDRSPEQLPFDHNDSVESELKRLRLENVRMKGVIKNELQPLRMRCDQLLEETKKKTNIILSLEARLGFGGPPVARMRPM